MSSRDGTFSHNLFGIKASDDWQGDSVARRTVEFAGGIARHEVAKFRSYDDVAASFDDYAEFLSTRPRYAAVIGSGADIDGFANAIADSGYATDPAYAQKISRVANSETMNRVLEPLKNAAAVSINE
jgi:flagellar protein FlgJ